MGQERNFNQNQMQDGKRNVITTGRNIWQREEM